MYRELWHKLITGAQMEIRRILFLAAPQFLCPMGFCPYSYNVSFSVEWQRFARSVETPMENRNLLSGEQQDGNASELDLMEGIRYLMLGIDGHFC